MASPENRGRAIPGDSGTSIAPTYTGAMSVFTAITEQQLAALLADHNLRPVSFHAASEGIENSNFFVHAETPEGDSRQLVLTLLENLEANALPWFVTLLSKLDQAGLPVPRPLEGRRGTVSQVAGKPALLVPRLPGQHVDQSHPGHCEAVGAALATLHACSMPRPTHHDGPAEQLVALMPLLHDEPQALQHDALGLLTRWAAREGMPVLCHGDLFRDNVLFEDDQLSGLLDFYNAGHELAVWDLAVASNDWCVNPDGSPDPARERALLMGYGRVRALPMQELALLPLARTVAALRFYLSRRKPARAGAEGRASKDPAEFMRIYQQRLERLGRDARR